MTILLVTLNGKTFHQQSHVKGSAAVCLRIIEEMEVNGDIPFAAISVVHIHEFLQLPRGKFDKICEIYGNRMKFNGYEGLNQ